MKINPEHIHFILVEPQHPGNIGAAARAIKTMGFSKLLLVNPCDYDVPEAIWMAHAAEDILENLAVFETLPEALIEIHFAVATTQRVRGYHFPYYTPPELSQKIIPLSQEHNIALVFGREKSGLTNAELRCCHAISTIPAAVNHPSLNLAQAVMLYAYELYRNSWEKEKRFKWRLASYKDMEAMYEHLEASLRKVQFIPMDNWENFLMRFRRFFARANPEVRDVGVMHKILQAFDEYIMRLENQQQEK